MVIFVLTRLKVKTISSDLLLLPPLQYLSWFWMKNTPRGVSEASYWLRRETSQGASHSARSAASTHAISRTAVAPEWNDRRVTPLSSRLCPPIPCKDACGPKHWRLIKMTRFDCYPTLLSSPWNPETLKGTHCHDITSKSTVNDFSLGSVV